MLISIISIVLAGILNSCMDVLRYRFKVSIFQNWKHQNWVNPSLSWKNKWKPKSELGDKIMSTMLVFVTDFWHLCKFLMLLLISTSIVFYQPMFIWYIDVLIFYSLFTIIFEIFFSKVLIKKKENI